MLEMGMRYIQFAVEEKIFFDFCFIQITIQKVVFVIGLQKKIWVMYFPF